MSDWTDEQIDLVKVRWKEGLSASQIARELGGVFSRNAVIGKIYRMGMTRQNNFVRQRHLKSPTVKPPKPFVPRVVLQAPEPIGPQDDFPAAGLCQHTDDHPAIQHWRMCGHPGFVKVIHGQNVTMHFCEFHWVLNHQSTLPPATSETVTDHIPDDERPPVLMPHFLRKKKLA